MIITRKLGAYCRLARFDRPAGWLLLLWPTLWALWSATDGQPGWSLFGLFFGAVVLTRAAGCCVNDMADARFDALVARTKSRPLPAGEIKMIEALAVTVVLAVMCLLLWLLLTWPARWWALAAVVIAVTYPFAKRFVNIPQLHLGIAFGMGIPVVFVHVTGSVPPTVWLLFMANLFWVLAYDTIYAMIDREDDVRIGIKSSAIWLGDKEVLAIALCYFLMIAFLMTYGVLTGALLVFYIATGLGLLNARRYVRMIRSRRPEDCWQAFRENHWLGALILLGFIADTATR